MGLSKLLRWQLRQERIILDDDFLSSLLCCNEQAERNNSLARLYMKWRLRCRMKKILSSALIAVLSLIGNFAFSAQEKSAPLYSSKTELLFKSCLFEAERSSGLLQKKTQPDIFLMAKIYESGLEEEAPLQLKSLKDYFHLPELRLTEESPETGITWETYKEIYDDKGKFLRKEKEKSKAKIRKTAIMNGEEYTVFLIPKEINTEENIFKFAFEIYRTQSGKESSSLAPIELLTKKEILWNFKGPLVAGFFFEQEAYFLTFTVRVSISSFGGRLGTGLTWII